MAIPRAFHRPAFFQAVTILCALAVLCVLAVLVAHVVRGRYECPTFSCGELRNISYPFRRREDPPGCGVPSYELVCNSTKATIQIKTGTYYVTDINHVGYSTFVVVDASLDMQSDCPLPLWDHLPYPYGLAVQRDPYNFDLQPVSWSVTWASFLNCSKAVRNSDTYIPVDCLSTSNSYVYVLTASALEPISVGYLETSCRYLASIPFGGVRGQIVPMNFTFADVVRLMRDGFALELPDHKYSRTWLENILRTIRELIISREPLSDRIENVLMFDMGVWQALFGSHPVALALWILKGILVLCRFVLMPLSVLIFLAHKYWKERITIDAVEKFLRMQLMIGPTRYAYTDIIAITSHFRDKLGQGGYGSVYKGVLLPGNVHVAVKMLGNSNCNGEDFISEVSTIGRIHHINVVRLVGFCSEEMRRALVYEYMPNGSLDKYIFSSEKVFSWDKLNEIALGIARGINYLHQGCDMQIVHFDIKPYNILLDSNFIPKVADFGLAKLCPKDHSFVPMSAMRGTVGYIAPEMISRCFGAISNKSDVYSFGMLLLEMAGGRRNADMYAGSSSQTYYPSWVYSQLTRQEVGEISDVVDMHELEKKLCIIGLWCIQMRSHDRPTMSEVIEMLESGVDGMEMPPRPFFCDDDQVPVVDASYMSSEMAAISEDVEDDYMSSEMAAISEDVEDEY